MFNQTFFNLASVDSSWHECIQEGLLKMDTHYLNTLTKNCDWLPGPHKIFNAFSVPVYKVNYLLFGESPYPRLSSANGYAFWDANVQELWASTGLAKPVNRATSLRNFIKMLLIAENLLSPACTSQVAIAQIDTSKLIQTNNELFNHLLEQGFLLLNTSLVLQKRSVKEEAKAWQPFIQHIIKFLYTQNPAVFCLLLGKIANSIDPFIKHHHAPCLYAEHPYNLSFIHNPKIINFFQPLKLLQPAGGAPP